MLMAMTRLPLPPLLALLLTACAAAPAAPPAAVPAPVPVDAAGTTPVTPTVTRSLPPPNYPSPRPSTAARPSATTIGVTVTGTVYSDQLLELYNATVSLQSLDPKKPFSFRVKAPKGVYTIAGVPPGVNAKVTAVHLNYQPRTQMVTFSQPQDGSPYKLDFRDAYGLPKL
jgi:hypothetical protein